TNSQTLCNGGKAASPTKEISDHIARIRRRLYDSLQKLNRFLSRIADLFSLIRWHQFLYGPPIFGMLSQFVRSIPLIHFIFAVDFVVAARIALKDIVTIRNPNGVD